MIIKTTNDPSQKACELELGETLHVLMHPGGYNSPVANGRGTEDKITLVIGTVSMPDGSAGVTVHLPLMQTYRIVNDDEFMSVSESRRFIVCKAGGFDRAFIENMELRKLEE